MKKALTIILGSFLLINLNLKPAIEEIILKINNLNCPDCSKKLAQNIVKIPAVTSVTIDEDKSNMHIKVEPNSNLNIKNLQSVIEQNSCKSGKFKIIASGIILQKNNALILYCKNSMQEIYLAEIKATTKEKEENDNFKEKATKFGKNLWSKTKNIFKNLTAEGKFETDLKKFSQNNTPVYFQGNVKIEDNGQVWLTKKKNASIKNLACKKAENLKLAFK